MELEYYQLVDRVERLDMAARSIACVAAVPTESKIFEGHFPDYPVLPGTMLVESIAQGAGFLLLVLLEYKKLPFLIQIDKAKLRTFVSPGENLRIECELVHEGSGYAVAKGQVLRDGKPIAHAELRFGIMAFPTANLRGRVIERAGEVGLDVPAV
jgi:3-hydroxyacyl-[acyl-carrier-protein] dehydratase